MYVMFKLCLFIFSAFSVFMSLVLMVSPKTFTKIEEFLGLEFGPSMTFNTVLEGRVNFVNDWVFKNHWFFGPLLAVLAALNTINSFFLL